MLNPPTEADPSDITGIFFEQHELAAQLVVTVRTLNNWYAKRMGPPRTKLGKKILYRKSSVFQWLIEREQKQPKRRGR